MNEYKVGDRVRIVCDRVPLGEEAWTNHPIPPNTIGTIISTSGPKSYGYDFRIRYPSKYSATGEEEYWFNKSHVCPAYGFPMPEPEFTLEELAEASEMINANC